MGILGQTAIFPAEATTTAARVDSLFFFLVTVCGSVGLLVAVLLIYFCIRYRRRPGDSLQPPLTPSSEALEWFWTITPFFVFIVMFFWGAVVYVDAYRAPDEATRIYAVGKQWMWKFQHPEGQREINTLHLPLGRPVQILLDVGRRDPQFLRAGLPRSHGCVAQPLHVGLVPADAARDVSPVLLAVLRDEPCGDDRDGRRDGAGAVRELALPACRGLAGAGGAQGLFEVPLHKLP